MSNIELKIAMTTEEADFFRECLHGVKRYYEYGIGGSTIFAWNILKASGTDFRIFGIDTSLEWVENVKSTINHDSRIDLEFLNIGATGKWGYPIEKTPDPQIWPLYPMGIRRIPCASELNLVLIDGRFRVACLSQTILTCQPHTKILIHDYIHRPHYHIIEKWVEKKMVVGTLALFEIKNLSKDELLDVQKAFLKYWAVLE